MKQLPVAVIKRLVFDCTDVEKDKELKEESEVDDYSSDMRGRIKNRASKRGSERFNSLSSADDSDISETIKKIKEEKQVAFKPKKPTKIEKEL